MISTRITRALIVVPKGTEPVLNTVSTAEENWIDGERKVFDRLNRTDECG